MLGSKYNISVLGIVYVWPDYGNTIQLPCATKGAV